MYKYNYSLITMLSNRFSKLIGIKSVLFSSFILFGLPFFTLFSFILLITRNLIFTFPLIFLFFTIGGLWLFLGPMLIVNWEQTFDNFQTEIKSRINLNQKVKLTLINKIYFNDRSRYYLSTFFSFIFILIVFSGQEVYKQLGINNGYQDPFFWLLLVIAMQIGFTAGFGFWGVFKTIHSILILSKYYTIEWKIFSSDKLGGLEFIYKFILNTTYVFSAGSLMIPFWLQIVYSSAIGLKVISFMLIFFYSISIASSFLIPSYFISKIIKDKIRINLDELSVILNSEQTKSQEFYKNFKTFEFLSKYDLIPLDSNKVIKFSISVFAPILIAILNIVIEKYFK